MMGDNVARCSMCKYDFQKASQGDVHSAAEDAKKVLEQKEQDYINSGITNASSWNIDNSFKGNIILHICDEMEIR